MVSRKILLLCLAMSLFALTVSAQETADSAPRKRTPHYSEEGAESCLRCHSGGEMRAPMARAVIGGLITSTLLTLLVLPALYSWVENKSGSYVAGQPLTPKP